MIVVIGMWHLGLVNCVGFAEKGYHVVGIDLNPEKAVSLQQGTPPLFEPGLEELMKKHLNAGSLSFTSDIRAVSEADAVIIAYDSPVNDHDEVDITPVSNAARTAAWFLKEDVPIIITSQVPLGTCEMIEKYVQDINLDWKSGVVYTPENLKLGSAIERFLKPDMLVFGANKPETHKQALALYESFDATKIATSLRTAEMVKHALNSFLATSITFINEIANLSDRLGADAVVVGQALKLDTRIGKSALMTPGLGFSGGTLARDVVQLQKFADKVGYRSDLLDSIMSINEGTFDEIIIKLANRIFPLENKTVGIMGLTYKAGTSTVRRSPAIKLIQKLNALGVNCVGYDPMADANELKDCETLLTRFNRVDTVDNLAQNSDAIVLVTEWSEFKQLDFKDLASKMKLTPIFIDSKNYLSPEIMREAGFDYQGFGRN
jgi:UDPglucose 6-dehydrogenase